MEVTVGNVTVVITDYKLLPMKEEKSPPQSPQKLEGSIIPENEPTENTAVSTEPNEEKSPCKPEVAVGS